MDPEDRFAYQRRYRQYLKFAAGLVAQRNGVGSDQFFDRRSFQALDSWAGKHRMGAAGVNGFGASVHQSLRAIGDGAGGIDDIIGDIKDKNVIMTDDIMTSDTLGIGRLLSMIASGAPMRSARLRALVTPPISGETTTTSSKFFLI